MDGQGPPDPSTGGKAREREHERLAHAVLAAGHGVALCDRNGAIEWISPAFTDLTGYDREAAVGRLLIELLKSSDEAAQPSDLARERIGRGEGFRIEILMQGAQGRRFWGDLDMRPVPATAETPETYVAVLVEARAAAMDTAVMASPAAVRSASRLARAGAWNIDLVTGTVRWGAEWQRILGRPHQIESIESALDLFVGEERARVERLVAQSIQTGESFDFEARTTHDPSKVSWLRAIGEPHFENGKCVAIFGASQDITAQREVITRLREQERFAQGVVDGVAALLVVIDEAGVIIAANKAFRTAGARIQGKDTYALGGNLFETLARLPGGHGRVLERALRGVLAGKTQAFNRSYQSQSGEWFRMSASRFPGDDSVRCVVITQSIEKLKRSERRLRRLNATLHAAREEADAANAAKSRFLATMSHEIRTPLNGVLGMAQAMEHDDLPPAQRERLGVIRTAGESLLTLLNDLLDLSRIEAGRLDLESQTIDIGEIARGVHATFTPLAMEKALDFTVIVTPEAGGWWRGDPTRIRQILNNLVSNAVKFTPAGAVAIEIHTEGRRLVLSVKDTGPGIPADRREALFEKFVQADASTTRRHGGSGLGLPICRELAAMMGGEIHVSAREGGGSVFAARLPLVRVGASAQAKAEAQAQTRSDAQAAREAGGPLVRPLRVLAADDNAMNRLVLRTLFEQMGLQIEVVSDGEEALAAWAQGDWDVILMDVEMPGMDGVTATREIRRREVEEGRARVPVIALTANAMSHQEAEYLAAGMDALSPKPIELERLLDTLESLVA